MNSYIENFFPIIALTLSSQALFAANELGEFCFSGTFQNTGNCLISIEATQHNKYYSLNGSSECEIVEGKEWFAELYSGIAYGSGYLKDAKNFNGALRISSPTNSDMTPKTVLFEFNIDTQTVAFKASSEDNNFCSGEDDCILDYDFIFVNCP
ncbi:hypothetical protein [Methylohalobius crimeensis]|uniref:hypothetical protein n=1 Tax=Methylohalobius crimeensis TaxID=244365 RepID=UPI00137882A1|nr:hypothetical protein [Methylohalobius crimeensis]